MLISLILCLLSATPSDSVRLFPRPLSEAEILCIEAEDQRAGCEYSKALETYRQAAVATSDSLLRSSIDSLVTICRNGIAMSEFCHRPKVAARQCFGASRFLEAYPLPEEQARRLSDSPVDTLMLADSSLIAAFFPLESEGYVYFSSKSLYGAGGFDLYRCRREPGSPFVEDPENLGFPYSSPADDYLFFNTPDGKFALFASNRGCAPDSMMLYAVLREAVPVRGRVSEGVALRTLCELAPAPEPSASQKPALEAYNKAVREYEELQEALGRHNKELDAMRRRYVVASGAEKQFLGNEISRMETGLPSLRKKCNAAASKVSTAEAECRRRGLQPELTVPSWTFSRCRR